VAIIDLLRVQNTKQKRKQKSKKNQQNFGLDSGLQTILIRYGK
jgi:hypothetical protein